MKSMQGDVTCALLHADLEENETIYVDMPMGFTVTSQVNLPIGETTMKLSVHEDNSGALVLVKTLPPQFTPCSKYYAIKTIWFHEEIHKRCVQLLKINTVEQLVSSPRVWFKCRLNIFGRKLSDGELWGTGHRGALQHNIVSCSVLCTIMKLWFRSWEGVLS